MRLLTLENVRREVFPASRSTIYRQMDEGRFPKPVRIGGRNYWRADVLSEWVEKYAPRHDTGGNESAVDGADDG